MKLPDFKIVILSVAILSFLAFMPLDDIFAGELTKPVSPPNTVLTFRDITDFDPVTPPVVTLDKDFYLQGEIAFVTITDNNANLDIAGIDSISAAVNEGSFTLTETGINSGVFTGSFIVGKTLSITYNQDSEQAARATIIVHSSSTDSVKLKDIEFDENDLANLGIKPVTGAVEVTLSSETGTFSSVPTVELSYANANFPEELPPAFAPLFIEMWYKAPGESWERINLSNIGGGIGLDTVAKTMTSNPNGGGFTGQDGQGAFVLAFNTGTPGGGGGGLVRPSLVVNALAGLGSLGGGGDALAPILSLDEWIRFTHVDIPLEIEQMILNHDSTVPIPPMELGLFENFDYPLTINDKGFVLGGFDNLIETQTLKTDTTNVIKFIIYEDTKIQHISLYTNLRDENSQIHQSDTQILFNDGLPLQIIDPNEFFSDVSVTINDLDENKKEVVFEITFAKAMDTSHIIARVWDPTLSSGDTRILEAIKVELENPDESPFPTEEPEILELQSQNIPIWIKNNAAWWSEQQIGDSDFVAGLEYLIKNGIINVPGVQVGTSSTEIPDWIKNNAEWWSDSLITDEDFIEAMQWLVANGVIQI